MENAFYTGMIPIAALWILYGIVLVLVAITLIELIKFLRLKNSALRKDKMNTPPPPSKPDIPAYKVPEDEASEYPGSRDSSSHEEPPQ